jgi:catechol 2,3-dioxygenase-like lactoylglutathione lyase family enzyme
MSALPIRRLDFVTIYSKDLEASKKFYVGLLEFPVLRESRNEFFQIDVAGVPICVDLTQETRQNTMGLEVEDLAATASVLRQKGLKIHSGSSNSAAREDWIAVKDPDGNEVVFLVRR